jgi:hypothetical protein
MAVATDEGTIGGGSGFFDFLGGLTDYVSQPSVLLPGILGGLLTGEAYGRLSDIGKEARTGAEDLAARQLEMSQFKPFTVTTATGSGFDSMITPEGTLQTTMSLSPEEQALQQQLLSGAGGFFGQATQPTAEREQAIFQRMRAAMSPEEQRQRQQLEQRLAAQGRLGTQTAAFGGTPEALTLAKAQEEARNQAMLGAMQQAQAEQMQQAALGQQFLGSGYIPQQQLIAGIQPGVGQQQLEQQTRQFGAGMFGEATMSGLEAQLIAEQARANLLGGVGANLLSGAMTPKSTGAADALNILKGLGIFGD